MTLFYLPPPSSLNCSATDDDAAAANTRLLEKQCTSAPQILSHTQQNPPTSGQKLLQSIANFNIDLRLFKLSTTTYSWNTSRDSLPVTDDNKKASPRLLYVFHSITAFNPVCTRAIR